MFKILLEKELKSILLSPKFPALFAVSFILISGSIWLGIQEYEIAESQFSINEQLTRQSVEEGTNWNSVLNVAHRKPDPIQIFVSGLQFDIGRLSQIATSSDVKLIRSTYSDETLFAMFRFVDFAFIIQMVVSLFAILLSYDAINGERESGTLKLTFVNSISRVQYLFAKMSGIWISLILAITIPFLIGMLFISFSNVPFTSEFLLKTGTLFGVSVLYITFFIMIGLFTSSLTQSSAQSFLLLLVFWVGTVLILPRLGVLTASQVFPTASIGEIEARQSAYAKVRFEQQIDEQIKVSRDRAQLTQNMTPEEARVFRKEKEWEWLEEDDAIRRKAQEDITNNNRLLLEEIRNKKNRQENFALKFARISPAATYRLAAMSIAGTNLELKTSYEEHMREYRDRYVEFVKSKDNSGGGFRISINSQSGVSTSLGRNEGRLDASEMPFYEPPTIHAAESIKAGIPEFGLLGVFILLFFGGTFFNFLRYDMR